MKATYQEHDLGRAVGDVLLFLRAPVVSYEETRAQAELVKRLIVAHGIRLQDLIATLLGVAATKDWPEYDRLAAADEPAEGGLRVSVGEKVGVVLQDERESFGQVLGSHEAGGGVELSHHLAEPSGVGRRSDRRRERNQART